MRNHIKKLFAFLVLPILISAPYFAGAAGLVPDCNKGVPNTGVNHDTGLGVPCDFNQFLLLLNNLIKFLLFTIATPLAALCITYAGFLLLKSGGNSEAKTQAKTIMTNVVIGYIIALAAWLIIHSILISLGLDPTIDTFLK